MEWFVEADNAPVEEDTRNSHINLNAITQFLR